MTKYVLFLCLICFGAEELSGQLYRRERPKFAVMNVGVNACIGGLGALVNKKPDQKAGRVFWKGVVQGVLGGTVSYFGKDLTYQIHKRNTLRYAWLARMTHAAGVSITQNAASNRNFWERWHMNLALLRLEYDFTSKQFQARLLPSTLLATIAVGSQAKLDFGQTVATGILIMKRDGEFSTFGLSGRAVGYTTVIGIDRNIRREEFYYLIAHEAMHTLQYDHMIWLNPFFRKKDQQWRENLNWYRQLSKYVYFDLNGITLGSFYALQQHRPWDCRWIEREADIFAARFPHLPCN